MKSDDDSLFEIDPKHLVSAKRLDLVVKNAYFCDLLKNQQPSAHIESLYSKHILLRTAGVEPKDPFGGHVEKNSIDDYLRNARALIDSIKAFGFKREFAIPYYCNGTLGNGAHRLAACLALNKPLSVTMRPGYGGAWDFAWFVKNNFSSDEMSLILRKYVEIAGTSNIYILWGTAKEFWQEVIGYFEQEVDVVGWIDIDFRNCMPGFVQLMQEIYQTHDMRGMHKNIDRKINIMKSASLELRVMVVDQQAQTKMKELRGDYYDAYQRLKSQCRMRFNEKLPEQVFLTLHGADSARENEYLSKLLLSPNNIRHYKSFSKTETRPVFLEWIDEFHEVSKKNGINQQSICVVGSSPLEVLGVRDSTDLDFTISAEARKQFGSGITHLSQNVDIVTEQYHRSKCRERISDDSLIGNEENHFYRYGLKFANIEIIEERKEFSARDKDLRDVELIKKWREETASKEDSCNHALESLIEAELYIRELEAKLSAANHAMDCDSQKTKEDAEFAFYNKFYEEIVDDPQKPWCGEYARRMIKGELLVVCADLDDALAKRIVLNIGSGCTGLLRACTTPSLKIELDPLIGRYMEAEKASIRQTAKTILLQAYAEDIPISDAFVDVVVCRNALDHVNSLDKAATEITRVLKPGGLFLLVVDMHQGKTLHEPSPLQNQDQILALFDNFICEFMEVREIPAFENFLNRKPIIRPTCYARLRKK